MKNYAIMLLALFLWCALMPFFAQGEKRDAAEAVIAESTEESSEAIRTSVPDSDAYITVYIYETNTKKIMSLESYVACAVSAVMPEDSPAEALKAQAVAIRSAALYGKFFARHDGFDVCSNHLHCCPIAEAPRDDSLMATAETVGEVLVYDSKPALTLSHLSSCICTESDESYPYLASVNVADEKSFACYKTTYSFEKQEFKNAFIEYAVSFSDNTADWVTDIVFSQSNRVQTVRVGGVNFKGTTFAELLGIDSLCFTVNAYENRLDIVCYGSGSGLGMSRMSAVLMANSGSKYTEILEYFYPGTVLETDFSCAE